MKKEFLTMALALTIAMGGFCSAEAVPCKVGEQSKKPVCIEKTQKPCPEQMKAEMQKRAEEFNKALGLSDAQIAKAKEIRANGHNKMKPLMEKKKAKLDEIRAVMDNDNITVKEQDKKVELLRADLKGIDQDIRQVRQDNEKEFKAILTPDQQAKYAQIKEEGRRHFREHRMPQGPEMFGHPGHHGYPKRPPVEGPKPLETK